jgi:pimeloyl-ACP methyl ester carboxylesterase
VDTLPGVLATALSPDGVPVRYEVRGSGEPGLVFVHGWSCDRGYWRGQVGHFAERHQVVAVDLAGHGESGLGRSAWTMPAFGADVVAVADQLGLRRVVLIGHSMGGDVVVEAALRMPGRVAGLVWVDVYRSLTDSHEPHDGFVDAFRADFAATTRAFVHGMFPSTSDSALVDRVADDMAAAPVDVALGALRHAMANEGPVIAALRDLAVPVVAINPDYRPTDVDSLARHGVRTVLMRGVGHFGMLEDPSTFNRLLAAAIEGW